MGLHMENEDGEQMNVEGRDLDTFLLDQKRYEEERKQKKAKFILEQEESEKRMQGTKMNANSRRILNRKLRTTESADANANNADGQIVTVRKTG